MAGLAAATALSAEGVRVTLLESRPRPGGRASSILDKQSGRLIDNCQHVSMGCCTNFLDFQKRLGLSEYFRQERELYFIGPDGRVNSFSASRWPAPFHLLGAFRNLSYLSRDDLRAIQRGLRALCKERSCPNQSESFLDWLKHQQQPQTTIDRFWHVVLVSALSESLDRIDFHHARKVFIDGFLANRQGWEVSLPTVPLSELYGAKLQSRIEAAGGALRLQASVGSLMVEGNRARKVVLKNGEQISAADFILAVPFHRLSDLLPGFLRNHASLAGLSSMESAPISSVHFWFDRPITDLPHAVFVERFSHWLFDRTQIGDRHLETPKTWYYQVVISASRAVAKRPHSETIDEVLAELREIFPDARLAEVRHARVITEHHAVFSPRPGIDELRPVQQSPLANLQYAGDWTQTGWPATMEGAVRSGYMAAENVLARLGSPKTILCADRPMSLLSKWLFRL
ncbi:MAG: hydroxysqualene dehydroxylase HpnE [Planctomycetaceae bacterium]